MAGANPAASAHLQHPSGMKPLHRAWKRKTVLERETATKPSSRTTWACQSQTRFVHRVHKVHSANLRASTVSAFRGQVLKGVTSTQHSARSLIRLIAVLDQKLAVQITGRIGASGQILPLEKTQRSSATEGIGS